MRQPIFTILGQTDFSLLYWSDLHLDTGSVLDHLELRVRRLDDGLEVGSRVAVLLAWVRVRKERKIWTKILKVFSVIGQL